MSNSERAKISMNSCKTSSGVVDSLRQALNLIEQKRVANDPKQQLKREDILIQKDSLLIIKSNKGDINVSIPETLPTLKNSIHLIENSKTDINLVDDIINNSILIQEDESIINPKEVKDLDTFDNLFSRLLNKQILDFENPIHDTQVLANKDNPVFQVLLDENSLPLCNCNFPPIKNSCFKKPAICQAKDTVGNLVVGCLNPVLLGLMYRPAPRVTFAYMCSVHSKRLTAHQCCPVCGLFCTEGDFMVCRHDGTRHFAHVHCAYLYSRSLTENDAKPSLRWLKDVYTSTFSTPDSRDPDPEDPEVLKNCEVLKGELSARTSVKIDEVNCPHCWEVWKGNDIKVNIKMPGSLVIELKLPDPKRARMSRSAAKIDQSQVKKDLGINANLDHPEVRSLPNETVDIDDYAPLPLIEKLMASLTPAFCPEILYLENLLLILKRLSTVDTSCVQVKQRDLFQACLEADVESIIKFLYKGVNINKAYFNSDGDAVKETSRGASALHAACLSGNIIAIHLLLQAGADINAKNRQLWTPLMLAVSNNFTNVVEYLLKAGAFILDQEEDGLTAFHIAAKCGNLESGKLLFETGKVNINSQDNGGWTPIIWAAENKNVDFITWVLGIGGDPLLTDNEDNTTLHWAAFSGSLGACQILVDIGCDVNHQNDRGDTPLHVAARQENGEVVLFLVSRGADISIGNMMGETAIESCKNPNSHSWMLLRINQNIEAWRNCNKTKRHCTIYNDFSRGRERHPIMCVNDVDDSKPDQNYLYVSEHVQTTDLNIDRTLTSMTVCNCDISCSINACACIKESGQCWYDPEGRLIENFDYKHAPVIFECNQGCKCWHNCVNRVVQNGITCRIQLFRTKKKGWGLRSLQLIPKGTFVCEYIGELITDKEANERQNDSYLFDLEHKDGEQTDTFCIDAHYYGNISRFLNHLCYPNLAPIKVFTDHQDLRFPRICFFACRNIEPFEELGFDYGEMFWVIKSRHFTCQCDDPHCRYSNDCIFETLAEYEKKIKLWNKD